MFPTPSLPLLRALVAGSALLLSTLPCSAQTATRGYDFLTLTEFEGLTKATAQLCLTPAFQGKTTVPLEDLSGSSLSRSKDLAIIQRNTQVLNQQLSDLTSAGWELVAVHPVSLLATAPVTRYLLRKPKP